MGCVCKQLIKDYVPSERERGLDALSVSERPYYRPDNNCFVKSEEQGLVPLFRVYGFGIDEFVKFKNRRTDPLAVGSGLSLVNFILFALAFVGN